LRIITTECIAYSLTIFYVLNSLNRLSSCTCQLRLEREAQQYQSIYLTKGTVSAAKQAAGSLCDLVSKVVNKKLKNGFAIIRPPGHHAEPGTAGGFCVINNVAVAAAYARANLDVKKVLIVDWDVHHGNGTQSIFLQDPNVLYFSVHRYHNGNFFPYSKTYKNNKKSNGGGPSAVGVNEGKGYNVNVGWNQSQMGDLEYMAVWEILLLPMIREYKPDLILVSAGFDCGKGDSIGDCNVSPECFGWLTKMLLRENGRVVCTLEGGYVKSLLGICVECVLEVLMDEEWKGLKDINSEAEAFLGVDGEGTGKKQKSEILMSKIRPSAANSIRATMKTQEPFWKFLQGNT